MSYLLIYTTASSKKQARKIAKLLINKRLAACVNISSSLESHYRWQGKVEKAKEYLLIIKTKDRLFSKVQSAIEKVHSYSVPEILAIPIRKGSAKYLSWLAKETLS